MSTSVAALCRLPVIAGSAPVSSSAGQKSRCRPGVVCLLAGLAICLLPVAACAVDYYWDSGGGGDTDWSNPLNWDPWLVVSPSHGFPSSLSILRLAYQVASHGCQ